MSVMLQSVGMKKAELAHQEARRRRVDAGSAADQMDGAVNRIVRALRKGELAELPGLGTIQPGKRWVFLPQAPAKRKP